MIPYERWPAWAYEAEARGWGDPDGDALDPELVCALDGWRPHYEVAVTASAITFTDPLRDGRVIRYERGWLAGARLGPVKTEVPAPAPAVAPPAAPRRRRRGSAAG